MSAGTLFGAGLQVAQAEAQAAADSPAIQVELQPTDAVDVLLMKIQDLMCRPPDSMHLRVGNTTVLDPYDAKPLMDYPEVVDGVTILMDLKKRGT